MTDESSPFGAADDFPCDDATNLYYGGHNATTFPEHAIAPVIESIAPIGVQPQLPSLTDPKLLARWSCWRGRFGAQYSSLGIGVSPTAPLYQQTDKGTSQSTAITTESTAAANAACVTR